MKKNTIKRLAVLALSFLLIAPTYAQKDKSKRPSPPASVSEMVNGVTVKIDYSRPAVKDRKIWDKLVPYGKVWRTGANEATWIEFSSDVMINGQKLAKGKYGLFTIPEEDEWTIIFNEEWDQWGHYEYKDKKDVLRVKAKPQKSEEYNERFTIDIQQGKVTMAWADLVVPFSIDDTNN